MSIKLFIHKNQKSAAKTNLENELEKRISNINDIANSYNLPIVDKNSIHKFTIENSEYNIRKQYEEKLPKATYDYIYGEVGEYYALKRALIRTESIEKDVETNNEKINELLSEIKEKFPKKYNTLIKEIGDNIAYEKVMFAKNNPFDAETIKTLNLKENAWFTRFKDEIKINMRASFNDLDKIHHSLADSFYNAQPTQAKNIFILSQIEKLDSYINPLRLKQNGIHIIQNKNELSQALSDINRLIIRKNIQETIQGDSLIQQNLKEIYEKINKKFRESDILLDEDNLTNNINNFKKLYNTLDIQDKNEKDINVSKDEFEIVE